MATDQLYRLLPTYLRARDVDQGEPLRALLGVLQVELDKVEENIRQLHDDSFIETCQEQFVPYLGDLVRAPRLLGTGASGTSARAFVANTLSYRRRKGTVTVAEQVARTASGWPARASESFSRLVTTTSVQHVRLGAPAVASVRGATALERLGGPFDDTCHLADVRNPGRMDGRYNLPILALFLWRTQRCDLEKVDARAVGDQRWYFHPLGLDTVLVNNAQVPDDDEAAATERSVPALLRRRALYDDLAGTAETATWFGVDPSLWPFRVYRVVGGAEEEVAREEIEIGDVSEVAGSWPRPRVGRRVLVDPERGRLTLPLGDPATAVRVSAGYPLLAELGGGDYDRTASVSAALGGSPVGLRVGVSRDAATLGNPLIVATLDEAIALWSGSSETVGLITIMDNGTYAAPLSTIVVPANRRLVITAAGWPSTVDVDGAVTWDTDTWTAVGLRPTILGDLCVRGQATSAADTSAFCVDGLLLAGSIRVEPGALTELRVSHTTVSCDPLGAVAGAIDVNGGPDQNVALAIVVDRSMVRRISSLPAIRSVSVTDSVVGCGAARTIELASVDLALDAVTVLGPTTCRTLTASHVIFSGTVAVERAQEGCIRYSYVPDQSQTPRRYRCQPDLALESATTPADRREVLRRLVPRFEAASPEVAGAAHPAFGRLRPTCPSELRRGGEDNAEMGAWHSLLAPVREDDLARALSDYLRFGIEAAIFYVT